MQYKTKYIKPCFVSDYHINDISCYYKVHTYSNTTTKTKTQTNMALLIGHTYNTGINKFVRHTRKKNRGNQFLNKHEPLKYIGLKFVS